MTEAELREELKLEYEEKLELAKEQMQVNFNQIIENNKTLETTCKEFKNLAKKFYYLKKEKKRRDTEYTEEVEAILQEIYNLETKKLTIKKPTESTGNWLQGSPPMMENYGAFTPDVKFYSSSLDSNRIYSSVGVDG